MARLVVLLITGLVALVINTTADAHHTGVECGSTENPGRAVCLPYADSSFAVRQLQQHKALTYCFDSRASNYPNFKSQVNDVNIYQENAFGFDWQEISGTYATSALAKSAGCHVLHSMPDNHGCTGCGAWIHYLNNPVLVEYRWQVGYTDWRTTIAHELMHLLGLHEHYNDGTGISCFRPVFGYWAHGMEYGQDPGGATNTPTVMDCGVGTLLQQRWVTAYDLRYACENIDERRVIFRGCGAQEPPCVSPCWDGNSWEFNPLYLGYNKSFVPDSGCGQWYLEDGRLAWGGCDASWGGRWNALMECWVGDDELLCDGVWMVGRVERP